MPGPPSPLRIEALTCYPELQSSFIKHRETALGTIFWAADVLLSGLGSGRVWLNFIPFGLYRLGAKMHLSDRGLRLHKAQVKDLGVIGYAAAAPAVTPKLLSLESSRL